FLFGISKNHFSFLARKEKWFFGVASAHTGGCEQCVAVNRDKVKVKCRERFFAYAQNDMSSDKFKFTRDRSRWDIIPQCCLKAIQIPHPLYKN
ncbi:MAG: hypothetical protein RSE97_07030, partial [Oscillospiraceae bacterium]